MVAERALGVLLFALVALAGLSATLATGEAQPAPTQGLLYLQGAHDGNGSYRNFTTRAPATATGVDVEPCQVAQEGRAQWCWQADRAPLPWTLKAGSTPEATITLGRLQRVPIGTGAGEDPQHAAQPRIDIVLTRGTDHEVARGHTYIAPPLLSGEDTTTVHVRLRVNEDTHWNTTPGDAPAVELQIHLTGLVRRDEPPSVIAGARQTPSQIVLPGFPVHAFRAWESQEAGQEQCHDRILAQTRCPVDRDDAPDADEVAESGAFLLLALAATGIAGLALVRRRRPRA